MTDKKIALITGSNKSVSGLSIFMNLMCIELKKRGYNAQLIRPVESTLSKIDKIGYPLSYAFLKDKLKKFDLVIGNSVGLTGAADLPIKIIYNAHSNSIAGNLNLRKHYEQISPPERQNLNKLLGPTFGVDWRFLPEALSQNISSFSIDKILANRADQIIAVGPSVGRNIIDHFEVSHKKVHVIFNGIEEKWVTDRAINPIMDLKKVNVVFTGRAGDSPLLVFLKGIDRLLGAMKNLKNARAIALVRVNNENLHPIYSNIFSQHNIETIFNLNNQDIPNYLRFGDIYLHTSRSEACSLALFEAMGSGMAVICFPSGVVMDVIETGENGFIVHSINEMREKIIELTANSTLRDNVAAKARQTIKDKFLLPTMFEKYIKIIDKVLK